MARDAELSRVLVGLKDRLLAPALVEEFVRAYVAEVNAANRERGSRQAGLQGQVAKFDRQIRNLLELIEDGYGGVAMAAELREVEARRETLRAEVAWRPLENAAVNALRIGLVVAEARTPTAPARQLTRFLISELGRLNSA